MISRALASRYFALLVAASLARRGFSLRLPCPLFDQDGLVCHGPRYAALDDKSGYWDYAVIGSVILAHATATQKKITLPCSRKVTSRSRFLFAHIATSCVVTQRPHVRTFV